MRLRYFASMSLFWGSSCVRVETRFGIILHWRRLAIDNRFVYDILILDKRFSAGVQLQLSGMPICFKKKFLKIYRHSAGGTLQLGGEFFILKENTT